MASFFHVLAEVPSRVSSTWSFGVLLPLVSSFGMADWRTRRSPATRYLWREATAPIHIGGPANIRAGHPCAIFPLRDNQLFSVKQLTGFSFPLSHVDKVWVFDPLLEDFSGVYKGCTDRPYLWLLIVKLPNKNGLYAAFRPVRSPPLPPFFLPRK